MLLGLAALSTFTWKELIGKPPMEEFIAAKDTHELPAMETWQSSLATLYLCCDKQSEKCDRGGWQHSLLPPLPSPSD